MLGGAMLVLVTVSMLSGLWGYLIGEPVSDRLFGVAVSIADRRVVLIHRIRATSPNPQEHLT